MQTAISHRLKEKPSEYIKRLYFDSIAYSKPALGALMGFVDEDRLMFGTDNPFFPPLGVPDICTAVWPSTAKVYQTMEDLSEETKKKILYQNAENLLGLGGK